MTPPPKRTKTPPPPKDPVKELIKISPKKWSKLSKEKQDKLTLEVIDLVNQEGKWESLKVMERWILVVSIKNQEQRGKLPCYNYEPKVNSKEELETLFRRAVRGELFRKIVSPVRDTEFCDIEFSYEDVVWQNLKLFKTLWDDDNDEGLNKGLIKIALDNKVENLGVEDAIGEAEKLAKILPE